jgi:hypothetical protein
MKKMIRLEQRHVTRDVYKNFTYEFVAAPENRSARENHTILQVNT